MKISGLGLYYAGENMREDYEVVMMAVGQSGLALEFAHERLRSDKEIVKRGILIRL